MADKQVTGFNLPTELIDRMRIYAEKRKWSMSVLAEVALDNYLKDKIECEASEKGGER
jgi:hypothetical protein